MTKRVLNILGVVLLLAAAAALANAQNAASVKDDLFAGTEKFAKGASDVTELNMDPTTLNMVGGKHANKAKHTVLNVVRTYSYDKPGMYNAADVEVYRNKLNGPDWHCSVHTRSRNGESTDVCQRSRTDGLIESAIITIEPKELTFIHTIKQPNADGDGGMSELAVPFGPKFEAQMAIQQAQLQAQMAALGPQLKAQMAALGPQIEAQMKGFGDKFGDNFNQNFNWSDDFDAKDKFKDKPEKWKDRPEKTKDKDISE